MDLAPDFDEFIVCSNAHGVDVRHRRRVRPRFPRRRRRFTGDLDVLIRPTLTNAGRLLKALDAFGIRGCGR